jgi:hypothetical protein
MVTNLFEGVAVYGNVEEQSPGGAEGEGRRGGHRSKHGSEPNRRQVEGIPKGG